MLAEAHRAGDRPRLARHLALLSRWVTLLSLPMVIVIATFRTEILSLFGPEFPRASGPFVWLLVAHFANGVLGLTGWVIAMTGRTRWLIVNALVGVASNLALNFALVPRYGIEGAAWAALASLLLFRGLEAAEAFVFERAHIVSAPLLRALAAGGIALGAGLFARELWSDAPALGLIAIAAAQVIVYAVCVAWFRPALEDQKLLARIPLLSAILRARSA
jgi:O-antigen/teichoic acid export membrane protein